MPTYCHDTVLTVPQAADDDDARVRAVGDAVTAIILGADTLAASDRTAPDRTAPDRTAPDRTAQVRARLRDYQGNCLAQQAAE